MAKHLCNTEKSVYSATLSKSRSRVSVEVCVGVRKKVGVRARFGIRVGIGVGLRVRVIVGIVVGLRIRVEVAVGVGEELLAREGEMNYPLITYFCYFKRNVHTGTPYDH